MKLLLDTLNVLLVFPQRLKKLLNQTGVKTEPCAAKKLFHDRFTTALSRMRQNNKTPKPYIGLSNVTWVTHRNQVTLSNQGRSHALQ